MQETTHRAGDSSAAIPPTGRPVGIALLVLAIATLGLLHNHPSSAAATFAEVLHGEAAHRVVDAVVHGGFIVVLALQLACLALLAARLGTRRPAAIVALVLTAIGSAALMLSMALDGLVVPAIATRYVDATDRLAEARALFALLGTAIGVLLPAGLLFQAAGLLAWGVAIDGDTALRRLLRWSGIVGGIVIAAVIACTGAAMPALIGSLVLVGAWLALLGAALVLGRV